MKIKCDVCKSILKELGGLLFSPPDKRGKVKKYHVCKDCWDWEIMAVFNGFEMRR